MKEPDNDVIKAREQLRTTDANVNYLEQKITTLRAELEKAKKDGERYRWLRHGDNDALVIQHGPVAPDYHWLPRNERLDEMIDNAMKGKG